MAKKEKVKKEREFVESKEEKLNETQKQLDSTEKIEFNENKTPSTATDENKIMRNVLIALGTLTIFLVVWVVASNARNNFEYENVRFDKVNEIAPYRTSIPVYNKDKVSGALTKVPYYFYLRIEPKLSGNIPFEGELAIKKNMVIASKGDLNCKGDGVIAIANLAKLYNILGAKVIKDENASCDVFGNYMYVMIEEANETKIEQYGPACYSIKINNCEILEATERFMLETFVSVNELAGNENKPNDPLNVSSDISS
jgi:hypothetical protein